MIFDRMISSLGGGLRQREFNFGANTFSASRHVAQVLSRLVHDSSGVSVSEASLQNISGYQRSRLEAVLGEAALREISSLSRESSGELFWEGMLDLASRLEREGRSESAAALFDAIRQNPEKTVPAGIASRAQANMDAMLGRGAFGARFESSARRFAQEVSSPGLLMGMGVGATVFSLTRMAILSRLWALPGSSFFTRGLGARALASGFALLPESGAFWLTSKGFSELSHPGQQDWSFRQNFSEWRSLALGLGMMRASGFAFQRLHLGFRGNSSVPGASASLSQAALHQAATFTGLMASHSLETALGWRSPRPMGEQIVDSLVSLLHFHVAGRLSSVAFPGLYRMQRSAEIRLLQQENFQFRSMQDRSGRFGGRPTGAFAFEEALASGSMSTLHSKAPRDPARETVFQMSAETPEGEAKRPSSWSWGSVVPPAMSAEEARAEGLADAVLWLTKAVEGRDEMLPLNCSFQWFDNVERGQILREALKLYTAQELTDALVRRLDPRRGRPERLAAINLLHLLAVERHEQFLGITLALVRVAETHSENNNSLEAWSAAKQEIQVQAQAAERGGFEDADFLKAVFRARRAMDRVGAPNPLIDDILLSLSRGNESPLNFRKYSLLNAVRLSRHVSPPRDIYDEYLQTLFLSDRAALAGEWVFGHRILQQGRALISAARANGGRPGEVEILVGDLSRREAGMIDAITDLSAIEKNTENPFLRYDPTRHFSTVALMRILGFREIESAQGGHVQRGALFHTYAAELFERDIVTSWMGEIADPQLRANIAPMFQEISDYVHRRGGEAPHWPSLLMRISEPLLASSEPELAFEVLKDLHLAGIVPSEVFQGTLISLVTGIEIELHSSRDRARIQALTRTKSLFSTWSDSF